VAQPEVVLGVQVRAFAAIGIDSDGGAENERRGAEVQLPLVVQVVPRDLGDTAVVGPSDASGGGIGERRVGALRRQCCRGGGERKADQDRKSHVPLASGLSPTG